jgi:hypothetical protein
MKFWRKAGMLFLVLSAGSAFATLDPCWMFADTSSVFYSFFRFCDTIRYEGQYACDELTSGDYPDTGSYDGSQYINFNYQFTQDSTYMLQALYPCVNPHDTCGADTIGRFGPRPGYAGFKTAWDYGMIGFTLARYKYLILAYKGPLPGHKVRIRFWYNNGDCGAADHQDSIATLDASSTWKLDTIPIPESFQNRPDSARNKMGYYEMVVLINNLDPNDTTSSPPGNFKIDNMRLVGCNPIDTSPLSDKVHKGKDKFTVGQAYTLRVMTTRADSGDILTYQWKKNGVDIAGAVSQAYLIPSPKPEDSGVYTVAVTVSSTNLTFISQGATLTVNDEEKTTEKKNCGCGAGTGLAFIPPLFFKAMAQRKRNKKNLTA